MKMKWMAVLFLLCFSGPSFANEWMNDVEVTQMNAYQSGTGHFVWFTSLPEECKTASPSAPIMTFDEAQSGGKGMLAIAMAALLNKRKVNVQANGCSIIEIYLK
ncbi:MULTISPECIES: hypothetical protein [Xanthomonas]|uniref:hypothetical protein n=1 Tax=Xanthomonas TaxID=338 RepID=UPI00225A7247|nr:MULTISPECIES: hypothetical protein [Xanthomonas]MCW0393705.1 hypothetical protein [Xanthomonas sacchari]MCW0443745.1 hypothetical protein [Xanthomonas sacchari]MCW0459958.1 hypothetical protein [Xanthomonas sacchari]MDY4298161.1 hypothetical protein [Xanthomonas sp. LF02-5]MDY4359956.1 hypothetical protein [Xanthomonas sp. LF04-12]